jgi:dTMP kinase
MTEDVASRGRRGLFITFEGPDGSGKSTQARLLAERVRGAGRDVLESREPGGTPIGLQIRRVLLDSKNDELSPTAELLLMFASRAQNVDQWILPALLQGQVVISDRFTDSSLVYQGAVRGLGADLVYEVDRIACRGLVPDLTFVVDVDTETGLARARHRNVRTENVETRLDEQSIAFHRKAREAFLRLVEDEPQRAKLIDGSRDQDAVAADIWAIAHPLLGSGH